MALALVEFVSDTLQRMNSWSLFDNSAATAHAAQDANEAKMAAESAAPRQAPLPPDEAAQPAAAMHPAGATVIDMPAALDAAPVPTPAPAPAPEAALETTHDGAAAAATAVPAAPAAAEASPAEAPQSIEAAEPTVKCELCGEERGEGMFKPVGVESTVEQWYKSTLCAHRACAECLQQWITANVGDQKIFIRCPLPDCKFFLYSDDIFRLATESDYATYKTLKAEAHNRRTAEATEESAEFMEWVKSTAKICPACGVIIERSEGCNYMVCTCGHNFCYECLAESDTCVCQY